MNEITLQLSVTYSKQSAILIEYKREDTGRETSYRGLKRE